MTRGGTAIAIHAAAGSPRELGGEWDWVLVRPTGRTLDLGVTKAVELDLVGVLDPLMCLHEPALVPCSYAEGLLEVPAVTGRVSK